MVFLHPDALKCTQCGNKQLTVTFSKNPKSATFEQWFVLVSALLCPFQKTLQTLLFLA
jgi:hypothetical protein